MIPFSASDAALEGFHLIRRHWRVVLGWAGFNLLALVMIVVVTAVLSALAAAAAGGRAGAGPAAILAALVVGVGTIAAQAVVAGGVLRLELRPEEPAFLHLRLGRDEIRLIGVWLFTLTGAWVVGWVAGLAGRAVHVDAPWIGLIAVAACVYLGLRFSLTAPVSFAERRIDFPRSWRLTRGRALALLGMTALSACLIGLLMIAVFVALALIAGLAGGMEGLQALFGGADALQQHPALFVMGFAVEIVLTPVLWVLSLAPLVAAYRNFVAERPPAAAA